MIDKYKLIVWLQDKDVCRLDLMKDLERHGPRYVWDNSTATTLESIAELLGCSEISDTIDWLFNLHPDDCEDAGQNTCYMLDNLTVIGNIIKEMFPYEMWEEAVEIALEGYILG